MESLKAFATLVMGAALSIPLALLLDWMCVRGLLVLIANHKHPAGSERR